MAEYQDKSRRKFIRNLTGGIAAAGMVPVSSFASSKNDPVKITILHTNDVHSHIDPFESNHPKYPGQGGVAARQTLIKKIRSEERNVLLFDAGDIFQGTPYFNFFGGELEIKLMSLMEYDASTLGNHDFDNGIEGLVKQMPHASFPFLNCNYDFSKTILEGKTRKYKIFNKEGVRIGVFGLGIELSGLVDKRLYGNIKYMDPVDASSQISAYLKNQKKCNLVVCLSHLGLQYKNNKISDVQLARKSQDIDIIIGGHTHSFLDEPVREKNQKNNEVLVTQAGWAGLRLGRLDFYFEKGNGKKINQAFSMKDL